MFKKQKRMTNNPIKNELETAVSTRAPEDSISDLVTETVAESGQAIVNVFAGSILSAIFGNSENSSQYKETDKVQKKPEILTSSRSLEGGHLFNLGEVEAQRKIAEITSLIEALKKEINALKTATSNLSTEVNDADNYAINSTQEKNQDQSGAYFIHFLETLLGVIRSFRLKVNNSSNWMEALRSKKAKRGSAFMTNTKKKGTQYSQSQELTLTRSVQ